MPASHMPLSLSRVSHIAHACLPHACLPPPRGSSPDSQVVFAYAITTGPSCRARALFEQYIRQRGEPLPQPEAMRFWRMQLGPAAFADSPIEWVVRVLPPSAPRFPASLSYVAPETRSARFALAYEYMIRDCRAARDSMDTFLQYQDLLIEARSAMVLVAYSWGGDDGDSVAQQQAAASIAAAMAQLHTNRRHPAGGNESEFYTLGNRTGASSGRRRIGLPPGYSVFPPPDHPLSTPQSSPALTDAQGIVRVSAVHYAHKRIARRGMAVPAWLRPPGTTPSEQRQHGPCMALAAGIKSGAAAAAKLFAKAAPAVAAAHRAAVQGALPFQPINDAGHTEVFASVDFVACPHDGSRDEQYGFAVTLACTDTPVATGTPRAHLRSMVLLLGNVRIRIPFEHMSCVIWRPHMYPHYLAAPYMTDSERSHRDVVRACQLGSRTTDWICGTHPATPVPALVQEERNMRQLRSTATSASIVMDPDATAAVYAALGRTVGS